MSTSAHALATAAPDQGSVVPQTLVETRFGTFAFDANNSLLMPSGPLGFATHRHFGLANLPDPNLAAFKLLQSLDDIDVSFVVTPLELHPGLIEPLDIEAGAKAVGMASTNLETLLIVTARTSPEGASLSINLRAPVLIDFDARTARQVVLGNPHYAVQHPITMPQA
ncbi:flagellar assembly protein FliW [Algihabitans albus]|uniref:flagellar assembly protein FliW n=1 Tax=Algihabitans albus TaxID=2164067 RepID=UPI000E5C7358|nr:flagellar assembly protein FliW [Algihabitans albus]